MTRTIPEGQTTIAASQGRVDGSTVDLGTLASGSSATITLTTTAETNGTFTNTVSAYAGESDLSPADDSASVSTRIGIAFTSSPPPGGRVGQAYDYTYTASGDSGVTFAITAGSLPAGLSLSSTGELSGTPTAAGDFTYTVTATGASGANATRQETLSVAPGPIASVSPSSLEFGTQTLGSASAPQTSPS